MKGAGDDHFDELVLSQRDAVFRMGSVAFSLAGNCARRRGRGRHGIVPSRIGALSAGRQYARVDAADSSGDIRVLFATAFQDNGNREVVAARELLVVVLFHPLQELADVVVGRDRGVEPRALRVRLLI